MLRDFHVFIFRNMRRNRTHVSSCHLLLGFVYSLKDFLKCL